MGEVAVVAAVAASWILGQGESVDDSGGGQMKCLVDIVVTAKITC